MNYIQNIKVALKKQPEMEGCEDELLDLYTLLVLVKGQETTASDIHDAWAVWQNRMYASHRSIVPFENLPADMQELDKPYKNAVARVSSIE